MSITYMNLTGDNVAPYKVNHFTWSASTNEVTANITISSSYIGAETDLTVELELDHEDKFNRDPNQNYFMPKLCFSITYDGRIYANREKLMRLQNGEIDHIHCDREAYQWEFDRQSDKDDLADYGCIKSINTVVWQNVDRFIRETLRENEHIKDRAEFLDRQLIRKSQLVKESQLEVANLTRL